MDTCKKVPDKQPQIEPEPVVSPLQAGIVFDVVIKEVADESISVAASKKKPAKFVTDILKNPGRFLNDFEKHLVSQGFKMIQKPYKSSGSDPNSVSCYFLASMTTDFSDRAEQLDLATVFCVRTSDHDLLLSDLRNAVQDAWLQTHAANLTNNPNQEIKVIRIIIQGNKTYSEYLKACKDRFDAICEYYRNFGKWPATDIEEVNV